MCDISEDVSKLEINEDLFKSIKFFISGNVQENVILSVHFQNMFVFIYNYFRL